MSTTADRTAARTRAGDAAVSPDGSHAAAPRTGRVELVLDQIEQLPTLPAVATHLLTMTTRPDTSAREVIDVLESDPSHFVPVADAISNEYVEREASGDFTQFVRSWFERDAAAARAWVEALPPGAKRRFGRMSLRLGAPLRETGGAP